MMKLQGFKNVWRYFRAVVWPVERIRLPKVGRCFTIRSRIDDGQGYD